MSVSKEEYLKRYLSGTDASEGKKKKKKKPKAVTKAQNLRIFDDDVDLKSMTSSDPTKTLEDELPDEEPTVAEVVDERPEEIRTLEAYRSSDRWKQLGADSKKNRQRHDSSDSDGSPVPKVRHDSDSDASPVRSTRQRNDSDSDQSIPRKQRVRHDSSDSDQSLPRKQTKRHDSSDSDQSPLRRQDSDQSPPRKRRSKGGKSDSDNSPPRRKSKEVLRKRSGEKLRSQDSDPSPPRKHRKSRNDSESDQSPPRKSRHDSDSDQSPPRKTRKNKSDSDSDMSPVRRKPTKPDSDESPPRKKGRTRYDSDESPPRRNKKRADSDSDASPPRRRRKGESRWSQRSPKSSSKSRDKRRSDGEDDERDDRGRRKKTLGGVKAGLSTGRDVRREMDAKKKKEEEMFSKLDADTLGKNAKTVFRDESGRRRNLKAEAARDAEENRKREQQQAELKAKYDRWGKGLAQQQNQDRQVEEAIHEASKPLARFKDDDDLDEMLKNQERDEDPMLAYMKKKKSKAKGKTKELPRYSGPQPPINRYGIWPGYRWDGVDRSNGFEKKIFMDKANRKALENIKYKWSTEDM